MTLSIRDEIKKVISTYRRRTRLETPEPKMVVPGIEEAVIAVLYILERLEPYVIESNSSNSRYIRFKNRRYGTIRISDHGPHPASVNDWHLRFDIDRAWTEWHRGAEQRYYPAEDLNSMCAKILEQVKHKH